MEINIDEAKLNIILSIDGVIHLVAMERDRIEAFDGLIKMAIDKVVRTNKTQCQLNEFLGLNK